MGRGIGVPFVADVSGFLAGTKGIEGALAKVDSSLDNVGSHGSQLEGNFRDTFSHVDRDATTYGTAAGGHFGGGLGHEAEKEGRKTGRRAGKAIGSDLTQSIGGSIGAGAGTVTDAVGGMLAGILPALGPIGAAIGVGALIIGEVIKGIQGSSAEATKAAKALGVEIAKDLADGIMSGDEIQKALQTVMGANSFEEAASTLATAARQAGVDVSTFYSAFTSMDPTYIQSVTDKFNGQADALTKLARENPGSDLGASYAKQAEGFTTMADKLGVLKKGIQDGTITMSDAKQAMIDMGLATDTTTGSVKDQTAAITTNIESLQKWANVNSGAMGAEDNFYQAVDDATKALKDNGKHLDVHTAKGRANRKALEGIAQSTLALAAADEAAGKSQADQAADVDKGRQAFIKSATAMGLSTAQAKAMADQLGLIPTDVNVNVGLTTPTHKQISDFQAVLNGWATGITIPVGVKITVAEVTAAAINKKLRQKTP